MFLNKWVSNLAAHKSHQERFYRNEASLSPENNYVRIPSDGIQAPAFSKSFPSDSNVYAVLSTAVV